MISSKGLHLTLCKSLSIESSRARYLQFQAHWSRIPEHHAEHSPETQASAFLLIFSSLLNLMESY